ncbi:MAG: hypothetical protein AAGA23_09385 [Pseudomonadota bacterium]
MPLVNLVSRYRSLSVTGDDATHFLHAQLTCDLAGLAPGEGCYGALLNPKGKVQAAGYVLPIDGGHQFLIHPEVAEATEQHLARYVLRAKVVLNLEDLPIAGEVPGDDAAGGEVSTGGYDHLPADGAQAFHLPDGRVLQPGETGNADANAWWTRDVLAGLVHVDAGIRDRFIPQMLGLDSLGAVSFSKGCYPGQEIVARARHLGRVKRGLAWLEGDLAFSEGQTLTGENDERLGEVIQTISAGPRHLALAVVQRDAATPREAIALSTFA